MRMMTNRLLPVLSAAMLLVTSPMAFAESLQSALVAAYNNSNLLEQNRAILRASDEDVAIALSQLRPQINANSTIAHSDVATGAGGTLNATVSLSLDLLIYDSGSTELGVAAAKETVKAARQQLIGLEQQVLFNAVQAYLSVVGNARVLSLRQNNLRLITQELRAARDRFEVGEVTRTDVAQAEARLAEARSELAAAQGDLAVSQELYKANVGRAPGRLDGINAIPKLPGSVERAIKIGEQSAPTIRQAQFEISTNELNVQRTKANIRPRIGLSADIGHSRFSDNNSSVGLTMTMPIYQGGQLKALTRRATAQVHASRANLNQQVLIVRQNVADAWSQLAVSNAQLRSSERQIQAAQVAFNGVREEAKLGARTTLDVLDAEQSLFDARTNRVIFETQVYMAAYMLLAQMGQLTVEALDLPVKRYDPDEYFNAVKSAPVPVTAQGRKLDRILNRYQKN